MTESGQAHGILVSQDKRNKQSADLVKVSSYTRTVKPPVLTELGSNDLPLY